MPTALEKVLATASKKYNLTAGQLDAVVEGTTSVTTGNLAIDYAIGVGGIPLGRSVELYGPTGCGKTTTALQTIANMQRLIKAGGDKARGIGPDDRIIYLDYEQAMDRRYAEALGVDTKHPSLIFAQPDTLEDGANFAIDALKTGEVRLLIFDSVAMMNPSSKADAEIGKSLPAVQAKLMTDTVMQLNVLLANHNASAIFLNHLKEMMAMGMTKPGMPPPTTTPGGKALKYAVSVRLEYKQIRQNKGTVMDPLTNEPQTIPTSTDVKVKVTKNKVAPPFREVTVRVRYGRGFDNFWTAMQVLLANKKAMHATGYFYFDRGAPAHDDMKRSGTGRPMIHGERALFAFADTHADWRDDIIAAAQVVVDEHSDVLEQIAPVIEEDGEEVNLETGEVS